MISGGRDKSIKIWDLDAKKSILTIHDAHTDWVSCLKSLINDQFASGSYDNTIKIWHIQTGSCIRTLTGHSATVSDLEFNSNNI